MDSLNANVPSSAASRPDGDPPTRVLLVMEPGGLRDQLARIVALEGHDIACAERLETARLARSLQHDDATAALLSAAAAGPARPAPR